MRITINKSHVGSNVYAIPTGNNARYNSKKFEVFHVVSMGRKYAELKRDGLSLGNKFDPFTGATQSDVNSGYAVNAGYMFFESVDAINKYTNHCELAKNVSDRLRYRSDFQEKLSTEMLQLLAKELGIDE